MKRILILFLVVSAALPLAAVDGDQVRYVGGTATAVKPGEIGQLDLTSEEALKFEHAGKKVSIPYADLESFQYTNPVARHLGVMPAIATRLIRARQRRHIFRIVYHSPGGVQQASIFEVSKSMSETLNSVLEIRLHRTCGTTKQGLPFESASVHKPKFCACGGCSEVHR